jgi:hypothetical protein
MHLTNNLDRSNNDLVSTVHADEAGAPDKIEVTSEMINAGRDVVERRWIDFTGERGFLLWDEVLSDVFLAMMEHTPR